MENSAEKANHTGGISDDLDVDIINTLQENPRATYSTVARTLNISESTIRRRMNALFEQGRLKLMALPKPGLNGYPHSAVVLIKVKVGMTPEVSAQLRSLWQTTYVSEVMGTWSICCIVRESTLDSLVKLIRTSIETVPGVEKVEAHPVSEVIKGWGDWRIPSASNR